MAKRNKDRSPSGYAEATSRGSRGGLRNAGRVNEVSFTLARAVVDPFDIWGDPAPDYSQDEVYTAFQRATDPEPARPSQGKGRRASVPGRYATVLRPDQARPTSTRSRLVSAFNGRPIVPSRDLRDNRPVDREADREANRKFQEARRPDRAPAFAAQRLYEQQNRPAKQAGKAVVTQSKTSPQARVEKLPASTCKERPKSNKPSKTGGGTSRKDFVPWCDRRS